MGRSEFLLSAVSKLSSPQNNARGVAWAIGWPTVSGVAHPVALKFNVEISEG